MHVKNSRWLRYREHVKAKLTKRLVLVVPDSVENEDSTKIRLVLLAITYAVSTLQDMHDPGRS